MIFDMNKNAKHYPWKPIRITADELESEAGHQKMQLAVARARVAIAAASMERILNRQWEPGYGNGVRLSNEVAE